MNEFPLFRSQKTPSADLQKLRNFSGFPRCATTKVQWCIRRRHPPNIDWTLRVDTVLGGGFKDCIFLILCLPWSLGKWFKARTSVDLWSHAMYWDVHNKHGRFRCSWDDAFSVCSIGKACWFRATGTLLGTNISLKRKTIFKGALGKGCVTSLQSSLWKMRWQEVFVLEIFFSFAGLDLEIPAGNKNFGLAVMHSQFLKFGSWGVHTNQWILVNFQHLLQIKAWNLPFLIGI